MPPLSTTSIDSKLPVPLPRLAIYLRAWKQGMVPLSAHQAIVDSYEKECKAAIVETAASGAARLRGVADDFAKSREETAARLRAKDEALANASAQVRVMSEGLEGLKRDVHALRTALGRCGLR